MNEIIPVTDRQIGTDTVRAVNARDLHAFLEIARDFNQWTREQISRAMLVEGRDYLTYEDVVQLPSGAKYRKEYALTLDSAKHIAIRSHCKGAQKLHPLGANQHAQICAPLTRRRGLSLSFEEKVEPSTGGRPNGAGHRFPKTG
jgi:anti-repressor protein